MHSADQPRPVPYRSVAFAEDRLDDDTSPPWSLAQTGTAALLCVLPVGMALLGGACVAAGQLGPIMHTTMATPMWVRHLPSCVRGVQAPVRRSGVPDRLAA